jgi:hypothetical protein
MVSYWQGTPPCGETACSTLPIENIRLQRIIVLCIKSSASSRNTSRTDSVSLRVDRAVVNLPMVSNLRVQGQNPRLQAWGSFTSLMPFEVVPVRETLAHCLDMCRLRRLVHPIRRDRQPCSYRRDRNIWWLCRPNREG